MSNTYYPVPVNLGAIIQKKELPRISLKDSISGWIHLLMVTHFGEFRNDESFGCQIWEHDFENIVNPQKFKDELQKAILGSITTHEPRLTDIRLEIQIEQVEFVMNNRRVKIRISLKVSGTIRKTNEAFRYTESFFIGPLSYY